MTDLNQPALFHHIDAQRMMDRMVELPSHIEDAWAATRRLTLPASHTGASNITICGMGGSAIGGDLVRSLVEPSCSVPINIVRGYDLPGYVGGGSLVVLSS